jgi:hypothetical protein
LADLARRTALGTAIRLTTIKHETHSRADYPDEVDTNRGILANITERVNKNYWRELADYTSKKGAFVPIGLVATNAGTELARNVRLEVVQAKNSSLAFMAEKDVPRFPQSKSILFTPELPRSIFKTSKATPEVLDHGDRWTVTIEFGDIQPKAQSWAEDPLLVSSDGSGIHTLQLRIYADNLSEPHESEIQLEFDVEARPKLTLENLREVERQYWEEREAEIDDYL